MTPHHPSQNLRGDDAGERSESAGHPAELLRIEQFTRRNDRGLRRPLAALFGPALDRRLAAGCPPESGALLGARAERLVSLPTRRRLVRDWEGMLDEARSAPRARNPHAPLCRNRVAASAADLRAMLAALSNPLPVPARGVAMANRLLSDGTGPLYNKNCSVPLSSALQALTAQLNPAQSYAGTSANRL